MALLVLLTASCGPSATKSLPQPTTTTTPRSPVSARDALVFREVLGSVPYDIASTSFPTPSTLSGASAADTTCESGKRVTPPQQVRATTDVVLADREKTACYLLGPTLLTGHDIGSAVAVRDENTGSWVVNFHFNHDDFVPEIAGPYVGKQIAIIFRDVVESAPTINPGITGNDVTISGGFDEATARNLANALSYAKAVRASLAPANVARFGRLGRAPIGRYGVRYAVRSNRDNPWEHARPTSRDR